jgi:hypothetical protein
VRRGGTRSFVQKHMTGSPISLDARFSRPGARCIGETIGEAKRQ